MIIDLSSFFDKTTLSMEINETLDLDCIDVNGRDIYFTEPVKITGKIYKVSNDMILEGKIKYKYKENCARCLKEFEKEIYTDLSGKLVEESKAEEDRDDEEAIPFKDKKLNLKNAIVSQIILSFPMKSICKADCKGLCPMCGKNLNKGECDCEVDDIDPRMAKLKELL